ncbi:MAG: AsmA-like C-terminal region-containing protein, partial [Burkholderiales bacterium]
ADWRRALRCTLALRDARLELPLAGVRTVSVALSDAQVEWLAGDTLRAHAKGAVGGEKFETRVEGPDAGTLFEARPWKVSASAAFGALRAQARGELKVRERHVTADLDVTAGAASLAGLPLEARGHARLGESDWRVELASLRLGQTRGRASLAGALPPTKRPIAAHADFELLDLAPLAQRAPKADSRLWERELLPRGARLPDTDIEIDAARVTLPRRATLGLSARAQLRGGRVSADLDARDLSVPQFGATAGRVRLQASASGATLAALAGGATLKLQARDARIAAQLEGAAPEASIVEADLSAAPGERTRANVAGSVRGLPLALQASAAPLSTLLPAGGGEFEVSGRLGEVRMTADWERTAPLRLRIEAPRLDAFDALLARRLPQAGPVTLDATLHELGASQRSVELALAVGESRLGGRITDARAQGRHSVDIELQSSLLRLEDVGFHQPAGRTERAAGGSAKEAEGQLGRRLERAEAQVVTLRRALREIEGRLQLSVARVTSGDSDLGRAEGVATLKDGRLRVAPFKLDAPKGKLAFALDADLSTDDPRYRLEGEIDQFQYGALLKRVDATRQAEGSLSLKLALAAHGPLDALASSLEGTADFTVFPTAYRTHALDLWGGGLIRAMGTALEGEKGARVNCAVAAFNVSGGLAKSEALMLDSTSMRAAGELEINLLDHRLKGFMAPKSKSARLVSPLVPVGIGGTLEKPEVGVEVAGIPLAAVRTFYFVPTYLYDTFFSGTMPADGSADCIKAYRRIPTK